jgi:hypothetical protein
MRLETGVNNPPSACRVTALQIAARPTRAWSLSATISQYFIGGMMPELANPVQQSLTVVEIRLPLAPILISSMADRMFWPHSIAR